MDLHPLKTEQDYAAALRAIEALWDAPEDSPEADQLEILVTLVEAYEATHQPTVRRPCATTCMPASGAKGT